MADWLKVNHTLVRSPKIRGLMRELRCNKMTALGLAVSWLCWVDEQTVDGQTYLTPDELAEEIGFRGGVEALISIGWAALGEDGCVVACEFGKHCGDSAKKRAEDARRQSNKRERDREKCHGECHGKSVTGVTESVTGNALPEKKRKEENNKEEVQESLTTVVSSGDGGRQARPADAGEVFDFMANQPACLGADAAEVRACAESFFNELEAVGWVNAKGVPVRDWRAMARSYLGKWWRNCQRQGAVVKPVVRRSEQKKDYGL